MSRIPRRVGPRLYRHRRDWRPDLIRRLFIAALITGGIVGATLLIMKVVLHP